MDNGMTWEEEMLAFARQARLKQKQAEQDAGYWAEMATSFEKSVEGRRALEGKIKVNGQRTIAPETLRKMSAREALFAIGAMNKDQLVATNVVNIMVDSGMYSDREHARSAFYSAIYHNRRYFKKQRRGHYRIIGRPDTMSILSVNYA